MSFLTEVWTLFRSMKFAVWILVILAVVSLISLFILEFFPLDTYIPGGEKVYADKYGGAFPIMKFLHLQDPFRAWWFQALLGMLTLSLIFCFIDNAPRAVRSVFKAKFLTQKEDFEKYGLNAYLETRGEFLDTLLKYLRGYTVRRREEGESLMLSANRGRIGYIGPVTSHFGLLLLVIGGWIALSGIAVFEGAFPGETIENPNFDFKVRVDDFQIEYYPLGVGQWVLLDGKSIGKAVKKLPHDKFRVKFFSKGEFFYHDLDANRLQNQFDIESDRGNIKDYISTLTIIENGKEIKTQRIEVNKPLRYKGFRFYQSSFDSRNPKVIAAIDSAVIEIRTKPDDSVIDTVKLAVGDEYLLPDGSSMRIDRFVPHFRMSEEGIISASAQMHNPAVQIGVYREGEKAYHQWCFFGKDFHGAASDAGYTFRVLDLINPRAESKLKTVLEIKVNRGYEVIWAGLIFCTLGLLLTFYWTPKHIWALIERRGEKNEIRLAGYTPRQNSIFKKDFEKIVNLVKENN